MTRAEMKTKAKAAFKANYWKSVLAAVIAMAAAGYFASSSSRNDTEDLLTQLELTADQTGLSMLSIICIGLAILGMGFLLATAVTAFLTNPLQVGTHRFFLVNTRQSAALKEIGYGFDKERYLKVVGAMFLMNLFITLGMLLLVIPGILLALNYFAVPYLLSENPGLGIMETLRKSKAMMYGHRWELVVLILSFLGWHLLGLITMGLLHIFYVGPYMYATYAEFYLALKENV